MIKADFLLSKHRIYRFIADMPRVSVSADSTIFSRASGLDFFQNINKTANAVINTPQMLIISPLFPSLACTSKRAFIF